MRWALLWCIVLFAALVVLTACEGPPPCLHGHNETTVIPMVQMVGKTPVTTYIPSTDFVCDEYAEAASNS